MKPQIDVASDWAKNWNGSIAIKVTAVTIWIILVLSFVVTIPFLSSFEESSLKKYTWQRLSVEEMIKNHSEQDLARPVLRQSINQSLSDTDVRYLAFDYRGSEMKFGEQGEKNYQLSSHFLASNNEFDLVIEFPSIKQSVLLTRVKVGSAIVGFSVLFGMFLFWVNKNIVHAPFKEIVDLTQNISRGETSLRLDASRGDEFGVLARFLNEMLDTLEANQAALKQANIELVDEIKNREEALAASQQKSAFLANMSHEIRTPLSSIIGFTERIRFDKAKSKDEEKQMLDIVLQNGNHLMHLINDILDLSKVEANKLEIEEDAFSILKVVEHTRRLLLDRAMEQGIELYVNYDFPMPSKIHNDPIRTKQILLNLAGNAIRFTRQGSVSINLSYDAEQDDLVMEVKDTGIGMSAVELNGLFKPFSQADSSISRKYGGTGLGLTISKRLAELMGGDIGVKSIKGLGSCFTCRIKAGFDQQADQFIYEVDEQQTFDDEYEQPIEDLQLQAKILLVEDTIEIQRLVTAYMEDYGIDIDVANNGQQGIEMALQNDYDLILMDVQMPVMNGKQATQKLRSEHYKQPIIALTADALSDHEGEFSEYGFTEVLTKPIIINQLLTSIKYHLGNDSVTEVIQAPDDSGQLDNDIGDLQIKFLTRLPDYVDQIRQALNNDELNDAKSVAHQLKGLGGSFGYPEITQIASDLEELLEQSKTQEALTMMTKIESFYMDTGVV